jgi:hypothetical protein
MTRVNLEHLLPGERSLSVIFAPQLRNTFSDNGFGHQSIAIHVDISDVAAFSPA